MDVFSRLMMDRIIFLGTGVDDYVANIIQAQRDYFGAHTYLRKDREGVFHYDWYGEENK